MSTDWVRFTYPEQDYNIVREMRSEIFTRGQRELSYWVHSQLAGRVKSEAALLRNNLAYWPVSGAVIAAMDNIVLDYDMMIKRRRTLGR